MIMVQQDAAEVRVCKSIAIPPKIGGKGVDSRYGPC